MQTCWTLHMPIAVLEAAAANLPELRVKASLLGEYLQEHVFIYYLLCYVVLWLQHLMSLRPTQFSVCSACLAAVLIASQLCRENAVGIHFTGLHIWRPTSQ